MLSGNYDITCERGYGFRLVAQDDRYNFYASYRQAVRQGMDLFLILGDPNARTTRARLGGQSCSYILRAGLPRLAANTPL